MAKKGDKNMELYEKKVSEVSGTNKTVRSQLNASAKYDKESVDNIRLRMPKGYNDLMKDYIAKNDKYASVNAMISELVKRELESAGYKLPNKED
jgi:hypothetical protein